MYLQELSQANN